MSNYITREKRPKLSEGTNVMFDAFTFRKRWLLKHIRVKIKVSART